MLELTRLDADLFMSDNCRWKVKQVARLIGNVESNWDLLDDLRVREKRGRGCHVVACD